jgi:hypothetical protein
MRIACGYILDHDQLKALGASRGLTIEHGETHKLESDFRRKHVHSLQAIPIDYPRGSLGVTPVPQTLMLTRFEDGSADRVLDPVTFVENDGDRLVRRWLEQYGIRDTAFVTVPES